MRRGTSRYVPYPDLLNFVIGAFVRRGRAREIVDIFEQLCAQVLCCGVALSHVFLALCGRL